MEFGPDGCHIPDGTGQAEDEGQVEALCGQIRFGGVGDDDPGVGHAGLLDLPPDVLHGHRVDVEGQDASLLPHDAGRRDGEEAGAAADLEHLLARLKPCGPQDLVGVSEQAVEGLVDKGHHLEMQFVCA